MTGPPEGSDSERTFSQQVFRSFLWSGGGQLVGQGITWVATIIVIRLLAPADYGLMAMALVFLGLFFLLADLGVGAAAVQAKSLSQEEVQRLFGVVLAVNVLGFLVTMGFAPLVADFFGEPRLTPVVRVLSVNFLLLALFVLPQSQLVRELDFKTKARVDVLAMVAAAAASLILAAMGFGVWALVASSLVTHGVKAVALNIVRPMTFVPTFSWRAVSGMAQFGVLITVDRLLFFLYGQADVVIGGRFLDAGTLGLYAVALSLAAIPMEKVLPVITQVSFAAFSRIQDDPERVARNVLRAVSLVSLICFPAFMGMAAVAGDMVPVVLGEDWLELIVPLQILCLVLPLKALSAVLPPALFGVGRPGVNVVNMAIVLMVMVPSLLIGVRYGVIGLCVAWVVGYPGAFLVTTWRSLRSLGIPFRRFLHSAGFAAIASTVMGGSVVTLRVALEPLGVSVLRLVLLITLGLLVYVGLAIVFQRRRIRELVAVVKN